MSILIQKQTKAKDRKCLSKMTQKRTKRPRQRYKIREIQVKYISEVLIKDVRRHPIDLCYQRNNIKMADKTSTAPEQLSIRKITVT